MSHTDENQPMLEMVADHRFDHLETKQGKPAFPGGPPVPKFIAHCKCGAHSLFCHAAGTAHQWHDVHLERVRDGLDPLVGVDSQK